MKNSSLSAVFGRIGMKRKISVLLCMMILAGCCALPAQAASKEVLYNGQITRNYPNSVTKVYAEPDKNSAVLKTYPQGSGGSRIQITGVTPAYVEVICGNTYGYILRNRVERVEPIDYVNTPPYGVEKYDFYAYITQDTPVMSEKKESSDVLSTLTDGACVAILGFEDGWAVVQHKRQYGYINSNLLQEALPVAKTVDQDEEGMPLAVYTSFYSDNPDRINNLRVACERLRDLPLAPGERLDFNNQVGRFTKANGYLPAPILTNGETKLGYGGGSCQVSSTLYDMVQQVPGITIVERHPHGDSGAAYLPHGMDASSGDLNFKIRNDYDFKIRFDFVMHDLCMTLMIYRVEE